jgi:hypothetical protein
MAVTTAYTKNLTLPAWAAALPSLPLRSAGPF